MSLKSLAILILVILIGGSAYYFIAADSEKEVAIEDAWLIPGLAQELGQVTKLSIHGAGDALLAEISKLEHGWVVENRDQHEADITVIRKTFDVLVKARLLEKKTANPENYAKLGVRDISDIQAQGVRFTISGLEEPVGIIVGKKGTLQNSQFVRREGDPQSWLIDRELDLNHDGAWWLRKDILDIPPERIKSIRISHMDGSEILIKSVAQEDYEFILDQPIPVGKKVSESELYQVANALSSLQLKDVASLQSFNEEILPSTITTFRMYDGLRVDARTFTDGQSTYVRLEIEFDENHAGDAVQSDSAAKQDFAEQVKSRIDGWAFILPSITQDAMVKRLEDFLLQADG